MYLIGIIGCWFIMSSFIVLPQKKYKKTIKQFISTPEQKSSEGNVNSIDIMLENFSKNIVKYVHLNDIKRSEMEKSLSISNIAKTPEEYMAYVYTVTGCFALVGLLFLMFSKFIGIGVLCLAGFTYYSTNKKLETTKKEAVDAFNSELPRYVAYLKQSFKTNTNVMTVMEGYITDNRVFSREMNLAIADAKTSNFNSSMARLDQRVNSDHMKMVIHGLLSAYNGENVLHYFSMLEKDFTQFEISSLKKAIKSIPQKMQLPKILIFSSVFLALATPLGIQIVDSFKTIFG